MSSWDEAIVVTIDEYWHKQAEEARVLAEELRDKLAKAMMLRVAEDCDKLADMPVPRFGAPSATTIFSHRCCDLSASRKRGIRREKIVWTIH